MSTNNDDWYGDDIDYQESAPPAVKFPQIGSVFDGTILAGWRQQASVYGTGELKFYEDGQPIMQLVLLVAPDEPDPDDDWEGVRRLYIDKQGLREGLKAALREAEAPKPQPGGRIIIERDENRPEDQRPHVRRRVHPARGQRPQALQRPRDHRPLAPPRPRQVRRAVDGPPRAPTRRGGAGPASPESRRQGRRQRPVSAQGPRGARGGGVVGRGGPSARQSRRALGEPRRRAPVLTRRDEKGSAMFDRFRRHGHRRTVIASALPVTAVELRVRRGCFEKHGDILPACKCEECSTITGWGSGGKPDAISFHGGVMRVSRDGSAAAGPEEGLMTWHVPLLVYQCEHECELDLAERARADCE